ncbi:MAG: hypothetical protein J5501_04945 [Ruminococcus sp.]|nr:hypothetical protein [Ruminococcus sp.]
MENTAPKKKHTFLKVLAVIAAVLLLLFAVLRATHIILRVNGHYTTCFATEVSGGIQVSELVYMKRLKKLNLQTRYKTDDDLLEVDFLTKLTKLEDLYLWRDFEDPGKIKKIPSLKNSPDLYRVNILEASVEDLDFISENTALKDLTIHSYLSGVKDISGLRNKTVLERLTLWNADCTDFSVLLELPELKDLTVIGSIIPDEIRNELISRDVKVTNYPTYAEYYAAEFSE